MTNTEPIKVMIVDDHDMLRSGLKVFLDAFDDMELVSEASNGREAVWFAQEEHPDVVLVDLKMPEMDGIETIRELLKVEPNVKPIILTSFVDEENVQAALEAGAVGYLLKDARSEQIHQAILQAYEGKSMLSPEATQVLIEATVKPPEVGHNLTDREIEILELLVTGLSNSAIGEQLHISRSTVKNHISNIFAKLQTDSRTEAAALAVQNGIVQLPEED